MSGIVGRNYENNLNDRRNEISTFIWASRQINPKVAYNQIRKPWPGLHKEAVLKSPKIQELICKLSETKNVPKDELEQQVRVILDEIGYNKNLRLIRWLGVVLTKICLQINSGILANVENIVHIKSLMGQCPVIFVPSHRSYADFILMSLVCFTYDVAIPAIAAGMDFHGMWGMGTMLRDTGAFFMRRTYNDDSLYWSTFKQYIYQLVTKGDLPIEFFIEGTRSRSCKSLSPKYGLISMVLKAFFLSEVPDILFVPINISYDRVLEENLFAFELLGVPKPKETTSGFFKSLKILKEKYGNAYFHFADAISAKEFFGDKLDRSVHSLQPLHQQEITEYEKTLIPSLAHEIVRSQQKHSIITVFNLMAVVLNNHLACGGSPLPLDDLIREVYWLKSVLESLGAFVYTTNVEESVKEALVVHRNLIEVCRENSGVALVQNSVVLDKNATSRFKAHAMNDDTMTVAVPFVTLQLYINPTMHYVIDVALLVVILRCHRRLLADKIFDYYHFLRYLFLLEFVTFGPREKLDFQGALKRAVELDLIKLNGDYYEPSDNEKLKMVLCNCVEPFMVSYYTTCCVLQEVPIVCDEKTILENIQKIFEKAIAENKQFVHPYCLNLDTLTNSLNTLAANGNLKKSRSSNNQVLYEVNKSGVVEIQERLEIYVSTSHIESCTDIKQQNLLQNKL